MPPKKDIKKDKAKDKPYPPAYFMSLTLENVRCFGPKQTLDLSDGKGRPVRWTVILGDNGVGKTTLLQCLAAMNPITFIALPNQKSVLPIIFALKLTDEYRIRFMRDRTGDSLIRCEYSIGAYISQTKSRGETAHFTAKLQPLGVISGSGSFKKTVDLVCHGYGASRKWGNVALSEEKKSDFRNILFEDDPILKNPEEWLLRSDYSALKDSSLNSTSKNQVSQVIEILKGILPDVNNIWIAHGKGRPLPWIEFGTHYGRVNLNDLSLGYRTMIAWMVDFAARMYERYPDSSDPLAEPAVVLVDEIDLHMHPKWQRDIKDYLIKLFPNTQFIVTAHSPLIVQEAADANVVLLERKGDHVEINKTPEIIKGWRVDQIYNSKLFGYIGSRSKEVQKHLDKRRQILSQLELTKDDLKEVEKLEAQIGYLPIGETQEERKDRKIIHQAAEFLKKQKKDKVDKD